MIEFHDITEDSIGEYKVRDIAFCVNTESMACSDYNDYLGKNIKVQNLTPGQCYLMRQGQPPRSIRKSTNPYSITKFIKCIDVRLLETVDVPTCKVKDMEDYIGYLFINMATGETTIARKCGAFISFNKKTTGRPVLFEISMKLTIARNQRHDAVEYYHMYPEFFVYAYEWRKKKYLLDNLALTPITEVSEDPQEHLKYYWTNMLISLKEHDEYLFTVYNEQYLNYYHEHSDYFNELTVKLKNENPIPNS